MTDDLDLSRITEVLKQYGETVHQGQPEQLAGRWAENGFEDPAEVEAWIESGCTDPDEARIRIKQGEQPVRSPARHYAEAAHGRDVARGTTHSRSQPGDTPEREPQDPGSPP